MAITLHLIEDLQDDRLTAVVGIYQASFPKRECMPLGWWVGLFRSWQKPVEEREERYLIAFMENDLVVGMAYYQVETAIHRLGYLYYLAMHSAVRGKGIGAECYQLLVERILGAGNCAAMLFEIEIPEEVARECGTEEAELARRRAQWYRRNGAKELTGIRYLMDIGWQVPQEMSVMLHTRETIAPEVAFVYVAEILEDAVTVTGELGLT